MDKLNSSETCIYNLLYTQFNEDFGRDTYFSYNLQFPTFYSLKNPYFYVSSAILTNINSTIKSDVYAFKKGLLEEEQDYNEATSEDKLLKKSYKVTSTYAVTFNKNHILSTILSLIAFSGESLPTYNELNNYNFDLLTGNPIMIKDIFNKGVNYTQLITDYLRYKISQNKDNYYEDVVIDIPDDQAFYITDTGLVIYFGVDEIAPAEYGIPKFKMSFEKFAPYISPRFYCSPSNMFSNARKISRSSSKNR
ncbi:MAG: DUF3298 domain-containing protein [Romboutsia sp.]